MLPTRSQCCLVVVLLCYVVCGFFANAVPVQDSSNGLQESYNEVADMGLPDHKLAFLKRKLEEEIERELADLLIMERQHQHNLKLIHEKKRQLEIKKREPVQCLVNIVSCWKRK